MTVDRSKLSAYSRDRNEYVVVKTSVAFSLPATSFNNTATITHNLGYVPYVKLWYTFGGKIFSLFSGPNSYNIDGNNVQVDDINIGTTTVVVTLENNSAGIVTGRIYARIYAEPQT